MYTERLHFKQHLYTYKRSYISLAGPTLKFLNFFSSRVLHSYKPLSFISKTCILIRINKISRCSRSLSPALFWKFFSNFSDLLLLGLWLHFTPRGVNQKFCIRGEWGSSASSKIRPEVSKTFANTQKYKINRSMRCIQNGRIECNKLLSRTITGKRPIRIGHSANLHPKISDGPPYKKAHVTPWDLTVLVKFLYEKDLWNHISGSIIYANTICLLTWPSKVVGVDFSFAPILIFPVVVAEDALSVAVKD